MEKLVVEIGEKEYNIDYMKNNPSEIKINGRTFNVELLKKVDERIWSISVNNRIYQIEFDLNPDGNATIFLDGLSFDINAIDPVKKMLRQYVKDISGGNSSGVTKIKAPMPGMVVKLLVEEGTEVSSGDTLMIIEAMKMENSIKSNRSGVIKNIRATAGSPVEKGQLMLEIH